MDKRRTKILIGCILCTMIVLMLFLIIFKFSQLSCELVSLEPAQLRNSQLASFNKDKPIRSYDKTILVKISAYLEYNIQAKSEDKSQSGWSSKLEDSRSSWAPNDRNEQSTGPNGLNSNNSTTTTTTSNLSGNNNINGQQPPLPPFQAQNNNSSRSQQQHGGAPVPSMPQVGFTQPQLQNSSFFSSGQQQQQNSPNTRDFSLSTPSLGAAHQRAEKRFLPLDLRSIETRNFAGDNSRHKYILTFNCTKLNMVLVHQGNRVYVQSIDLELKPLSNKKATCELQLPISGTFAVDSQSASSPQSPFPPPAAAAAAAVATTGNNTQDNNNNSNSNSNHHHKHSKEHSKEHSKQDSSQHLAHYYCNKPLHYNCYHYAQKSGPSSANGLLLAELHINAIEFETATGGSGKADEHRHVKKEFKSRRSECVL